MAIVEAGRSSDPRLEHRQVPASGNSPAVLWWALMGAAFFAFSAYLLIAWVTGPYFHHVSAGPIAPPTWMQVVQITWMTAGIPLTGYVLWRFTVKPWRRDGRPTTDGLMVVACLLLVVQDPWSSYVQHWFTYNAWLPNMGSWVNEIPGWMAFGKPGAQVPEPILWSPFMYCYAFFAITVIGCEFMRAVKRRRPQTSNLQLVGVCVLFMWVVDVVLEGVLFLPLGFYAYSGGHWALFPHAYHKFPLHEAVFAGTMFAAMSCVRYFVDDRGSSLAERGIDSVGLAGMRQAIVRFLAIFGAFSLIVLAFYNIPSAVMAANSTAWPRDTQKRSYFMDHICGTQTPRACPGPGVPISRGSATIPLDPAKAVPFSATGSGPFNGGPF